MRSRSNGGVIGAYALPSQNFANGVFFIHDAAIYNTGNNPIWPLGTGYIYSATGGTISIDPNNSNYKIHEFTSNGTFTISTGASDVEIFMVGGGGGGAIANSINSWYVGGGGGGGGQIVQSHAFLTSGNYTITVGQGGNAGTGGATPGNGGYTTFVGTSTVQGSINVSAGGGGRGGYSIYPSPTAGGSGGPTNYSGGGGAYGTASAGSFNTIYVGSVVYGGRGGAANNISASTVQMAGGGGSGAYTTQPDPTTQSYTVISNGRNAGITTTWVSGTSTAYGGQGWYWTAFDGTTPLGTNSIYGAGGGGGNGSRSSTIFNSYDGNYGAGSHYASGNVNGYNGRYGGGGGGGTGSGPLGNTSGGSGGAGVVYVRYRYK